MYDVIGASDEPMVLFHIFQFRCHLQLAVFFFFPLKKTCSAGPIQPHKADRNSLRLVVELRAAKEPESSLRNRSKNKREY